MNIVFKLEEIKAVASQLWQQYKQYKTWAFHGEMGSGKTTFIHALCEVLEVKDVVSSPTFAIINEYYSPEAGIVFHMDIYRLKDEEEALQAGIEDALLSNNYCLVEWPERISGLLPDNTLHLKIKTIDGDRREISV